VSTWIPHIQVSRRVSAECNATERIATAVLLRSVFIFRESRSTCEWNIKVPEAWRAGLAALISSGYLASG
jgi:hypothetical protein